MPELSGVVRSHTSGGALVYSHKCSRVFPALRPFLASIAFGRVFPGAVCKSRRGP